MKVILYMAITANGMIAKKNSDTPWSDEEFKSYFSFVRKYGNLIVGRKTFPLFLDTDFLDMGNPIVVVLTKDKSFVDKGKIRYIDSPEKALEVLKKEGFKIALVTGGGETNGSFLSRNLIDEIYLDVEPLVFGEGIPLFSPNNVELKLEFIDQRMLNKNTVQLHYKVLK